MKFKTDWIQKPLTVWIAFTLILVISLLSIRRIHIDNDVMSIFPESSSESISPKRILENFNPLNVMYIAIQSEDSNTDIHELMPYADTLYEQMIASGHFASIVYQWNAQDLYTSLAILDDFRPYLFNASDRDKMNEKLAIANLSAYMKEKKNEMASSFNPFTVRMFQNDPLGINSILFEKLAVSYTKDSPITLTDGYLSDKNAQALLMIAIPAENSGTDIESSQGLVRMMSEAVDKIQQEGKLKVSYLSGHRYTLENKNRIQRDIQLTVYISSVAIILLILLTFTRRRSAVLALLPAFFGISFSLGVIAWILPSFSALIIGCGALLIGISVDYGVHVLVAIDRNKASGKTDIKEIMSHVRFPLFLSAFSTIMAFIILLFSKIPLYRYLGTFIALGITGSYLFAFFALPRIVSLKKPKRKEPRVRLELPFILLQEKLIKNRKLFWIITAVLTLGLGFGLLNLDIQKNLDSLNATTPELVEEADTTMSFFGSYSGTLILAMQGKTQDDVFSKNKQLSGVLADLKSEGDINTFSSYSSFLLTTAEQESNRLEWSKTVDKYQADPSYVTQLKTSATRLGYQPQIFLTALNNLTNVSPTYLRLSNISETVMGDLINRMIKKDKQGWMMVQTLDEREITIDYEEFIKKIRARIPDISVYNGKRLLTENITIIFREIIYMGIAIFVLLIVLMTIIFKARMKLVFTIIGMPALGLFIALSIAGVLGITLNVFNALVIVFILGLLIDYCVFLNEGYKKYVEDGNLEVYQNTMGGILISATTTFFGFGAMIFARHPAIRSLGLMATVTLVCGVFTTLLVLPTLLKEIYRHDNRKA